MHPLRDDRRVQPELYIYKIYRRVDGVSATYSSDTPKYGRQEITT